MNFSYSGPCVMICRSRHSTGVQDYNICMGGGFRALKSPGLKLSLQGGAVSLCGAAAKILHNESRHQNIIMVAMDAREQLTTLQANLSI